MGIILENHLYQHCLSIVCRFGVHHMANTNPQANDCWTRSTMLSRRTHQEDKAERIFVSCNYER